MAMAQQAHRKAAILPHVQQAMPLYIVRIWHPAELLHHCLLSDYTFLQQGEDLLCRP